MGPRRLVNVHSLSRAASRSRSRSGSTIAMMPVESCFGGVIFFVLTFHWRWTWMLSLPGVKSRSAHWSASSSPGRIAV